jgi:hypothetical protein
MNSHNTVVIVFKKNCCRTRPLPRIRSLYTNATTHMSNSRALLLLVFFSIGFIKVKAQDPYKWTFTAKKISDQQYELHCLVYVTDPWHTYSQFTPAGGPVPTRFSFKKNPLVTLVGHVSENGKMLVKHEKVFGVDVKYFEGQVDFIQKIKCKNKIKTNLSGSVEFMVCNDQECLPPATSNFNVPLN